MKLKEITLREIFDSHGNTTLEASVEDSRGGHFRSQVSRGESTGSAEAVVLPYQVAKQQFQKRLRSRLIGKNFRSVRELDAALLAVDSSPRKEKIGGNLSLVLSAAGARGIAHERGVPLWRELRNEFFGRGASDDVPRIFSNFIEGGVHTKNNLTIQEYLVVAKLRRPVGAGIAKLVELYRALGTYLKEHTYRVAVLPIGDEGGYAINFRNDFEPLQILGKVIETEGGAKHYSLALDAAASSFYRDGAYRFGRTLYSTGELLRMYESYLKNAKILIGIEDPFGENDWDGFREIRKRSPARLTIGDDLTVTNPQRIERAAKEELVNAVIIKPNQIGTVTETCTAIKVAHRRGLKCIASHRGCETENTLIVNIARAAGVYGLKIGAPTRERMIKFNELIRVYG